MIDVTTSDGKYRYVQQADGKVTVYRNGEEWFTSGMEHNNMLRAFALDLQKSKRPDLVKQLDTRATELENTQHAYGDAVLLREVIAVLS